MAVCNPCHLSFFVLWIWYASFFFQGSLVQILSSVLIIWQCNQRWWLSSALIELRDGLCCTNLLMMSTLIDPYLVELRCKKKVLRQGAHVQTTSGQSLQCHKVLRQGAHYRTTSGWSPQCDKVLWQEAHFGPHLVKVRSETKSSNKGHMLEHIWLKSAVRQSPPTRGTLSDNICSKWAVW